MDDVLLVPAFARISDYLGPWALEPCAARHLWDLSGSIDLAAHVSESTASRAPLRSAIEKTTAGGANIAVIPIRGIMMKGQSSLGGTSTVQVRRDLRQAAADPEVGGILLAIESPGGTVAGTDDLAADIRSARRAKPVWAHVEDLGASAAYWTASQTQRITANSPTALIGSIGTLQVMYDQSAAAESAGIRTLIFSTGPLKGLGTPGSKITDEQAAHVQSLIDSVQQSFDLAVQKGRELTSRQLQAVRHGGLLSAPAALEARLIDAIQPLSRTLAEFGQSLKQTPAPRGGRASQDEGGLPVLRQSLPMLSVSETSNDV